MVRLTLLALTISTVAACASQPLCAPWSPTQPAAAQTTSDVPSPTVQADNASPPPVDDGTLVVAGPNTDDAWLSVVGPGNGHRAAHAVKPRKVVAVVNTATVARSANPAQRSQPGTPPPAFSPPPSPPVAPPPTLEELVPMARAPVAAAAKAPIAPRPAASARLAQTTASKASKPATVALPTAAAPKPAPVAVAAAPAPAAAVAPTALPPAKPAVNPALRAEAKALFAGRCVPCHGVRGGGDGVAAATLNPHPRDFTDRGWQASVTTAHIEKVISNGGPSVGKSPLMPAQADLKDRPEVLHALALFIQDLGR